MSTHAFPLDVISDVPSDAIRRRAIRRALPAEAVDLKALFPVWFAGESGTKRLNRDLHAIGATRDGDGTWHVARQVA